MKIFIDAGHGGIFSGAVAKAKAGNGFPIYEKDINLTAALLLEDILKGNGNDVFMTRREDQNLGPTVSSDLKVRCQLEHAFRPDCFISLHCNSFTSPQARGFEIWTSLGLTDADSLAEQIYMKIDDVMDINMRSDIEDGDHDREKHLYVLDHTKSPAVLLEMGFMSNPSDLANLTREDHVLVMMKAVANAIELWGVLH